MLERREWFSFEEGPAKKSGKRDSRPVELKTLNLSDTISLHALPEKEHIEVYTHVHAYYTRNFISPMYNSRFQRFFACYCWSHTLSVFFPSE